MTSMPRHAELSTVADWLQALSAGLRLATTSVHDPQRSVLTAVYCDPDLTIEQRQALQELYAASEK